jgi:hypothetical protein
MLNEPMVFTDIDLGNVLRKAALWMDKYYYTAVSCLVMKEELGGMDFWKVEIFYRDEE